MILKRKNNYTSLLILIAVICCTIILFLKSNFLIFVHDSYESLMNINPGFSSSRNLIDDGGVNQKQSMLKKMVAIASVSPSVIKHSLSYGENTNLPILKLEIKFENLIKINEDRTRAIRQNYLDKPRKVKAKILFGAEIIDAKVRLKGDLPDHWLSKHRFSLRVNLKGGKSVLGMTSFSIQKPRARQHPYEQAFQMTLNNINNLTSNHHYALVEVNGQKWGVMNLEEDLSAGFLEKKGKKDALIFRFSDDLFWKNYRKSLDGITEKDLLTSSNYLLSNDLITGSVINQKKYLKDINHRKVYSYILQQRLLNNNTKIYSEEHHAKLLVASFLWNNFHTLSVHNTRYYFNPYTLKLEPISSDQESFSAMADDVFKILNQTKFPSHFYEIFDNFEQKDLIKMTLDQVIDQYSDLETKLDFYADIFPLDLSKKSDVLQSNIKKILKNQTNVINRLAFIDNNTAQPKQNVSNQVAKRLPKHIEARHYDNGEIHIFPLIDETIEVKKLLVKGKNILKNETKITGFKINKIQPYVIQTELKGLWDNQIFIETSLKDNIRLEKVGPTLIRSGTYNPFEKNKTNQGDFLEKVGPNSWLIKSGHYEVNDPINLEGHLSIEPGVNLIFNNRSYFLITGTIDILGTKTQPVKFGSQDKFWKGFYLRSNSSKSVINHLIVENTAELKAGILNLTGGFTIYNSDLSIRSLEINQTIAEDAINIVNSKIDINDLRINGSKSDAFDCDFCIGNIYNSSIYSSGGDGFDFSGSTVELKNVLVENVKDKAVSAGENSKLKLIDSSFNNIGVGIASKDASEVLGRDLSITNYTMHAGMTYQKKSIFGRFSSLNIMDVQSDSTSAFKRQTGTDLIINGVEVVETDIGVKDMYSQGVMRK
jgi:hypothetical protein